MPSRTGFGPWAEKNFAPLRLCARYIEKESLKEGDVIVRVDPRYFRPTEVDTLLGDASKAKEKLGWEPEISFEEMVEEMVMEDLKLAQRDYMIKKAGFRAFDYNE